jgi:hypothetical protein
MLQGSCFTDKETILVLPRDEGLGLKSWDRTDQPGPEVSLSTHKIQGISTLFHCKWKQIRDPSKLKWSEFGLRIRKM